MSEYFFSLYFFALGFVSIVMTCLIWARVQQLAVAFKNDIAHAHPGKPISSFRCRFIESLLLCHIVTKINEKKKKKIILRDRSLVE